ncbi:ABC transporter ATP-binding protein [Lysinibacillus odysseyi]|uniref:Multidrug ABC transporter ATPase n=1 Tax=Lysinibacillus odysseyi 34hs-1 = NBRC 100172 TaxID=1220589 RepID=A0A0A3JBS8_9BACI|nr:ABC transporter ATP-binding protein [Lysinibacillus odysseyi]KGR84482.1 multidrug ABC transporter ATPase [Lysinibacillus odysseyi 34hs-1 = NBRC 100172]
MLVIENVTKQYGDFVALRNISLSFKNGVYGLLAPNGAGKTTLIKMLATLITPTAGTITYNGEEILALGEGYREKLGYLPQHFGYYKHYTPVQYLQYLAALKGMPKEQAASRIDEVLGLVALSDVKKKKMRKFSGGMIQRVGIAQALLADPQILILDEPTAGLDPKERARFRHILSDLARTRIILLSTHIVSDVESIANEIIMIKNKQLLYQKDVASICATMSGRIFETVIDYADAADFAKKYIVLAEKQEQGRMLVRFMAEEKKPDWHPVQPTLEDVFLVEYAQESTVG